MPDRGSTPGLAPVGELLAYDSATGASELEDFVQREIHCAVVPHVRLTFRTAAEHELAPRDAHTDRDQTGLRTSCAHMHSVPP